MLDFIERHKIGILATIIFHLLIVTVFLVLQLKAMKPKRETQIMIDFALPEEMKKELDKAQAEVKKQSNQEFLKNMQQEYLGHHIPVNEADKEANKSVDKMVNDIKKEMNIHDADAANNSISQKQATPPDKKDAEPTNKPKYTVNERGEHTYYKGPTTASYYLEGRNDVYFPVPVYKCEGSGKVVLDIQVDQNGYVVSAIINKKESQITEDCLTETATKSALTARFEPKNSAPARQSGRISYTFIKQ